MDTVPSWAIAAQQQWNQIREKMNKKNGVKWQRALKKYVDELTDVFTNLVLSFAAAPIN